MTAPDPTPADAPPITPEDAVFRELYGRPIPPLPPDRQAEFDRLLGGAGCQSGQNPHAHRSACPD